LRIGIDTGGTFTDIVSVDSALGAMRVTKVASTPANPAIGLVRGVKAILDAAGACRTTSPARARHDVATNALLQGEIARLGLIRHGGLPAYLGDRPTGGARGLRQFVFLGEA
jgi:N-methylhydantoinase A